MDVSTIAIIIGAGIIVGVINTFAGAGATITVALYSFLGLSLPVANATNRISVVFQTATMSAEFYRQKLLDWRLGLRMVAPTCVGAVIGSELVSMLSDTLFAWFLAIVLLVMLTILLFDPSRALNGHAAGLRLSLRPIHYILLVLIGFYGGAFHIGVGYLFLALFIMGLGYDLMTANALKGFVVFFYTVFALLVFALNGDVNWTYGFVHSIGNIIGAYFATRYARYLPISVLRYTLIAFIGLTIIYILIYKV